MNFTLGGVVYPDPLFLKTRDDTAPVASFTIASAKGSVPPSGGSSNLTNGGLADVYPVPPYSKFKFLIPLINVIAEAFLPSDDSIVTLGTNDVEYPDPFSLTRISTNLPCSLILDTATAPDPTSLAVYSIDLINSFAAC